METCAPGNGMGLHAYHALIILLAVGYALGLLRLRRGFFRLTYPASSTWPSVSVVVSFHNERENVVPCLERIIGQDYPRDRLEIIAVNDRSTDGTGEILEALAEKWSGLRVLHISTLREDVAPKKRAIGEAIRKARGEIILLTDADGRPGDQWVRGMVENFSRETGMVLGYAPYITRPPYHGWLHGMLALEYFSHAAVAAATTGLGFPVTCVGTNLAYRREVFLQLGGFGRYQHIHTGDDDLFLQRVREETSWQIRYATHPKTFVWNAPPTSFTAFYHQRLRYASKGFYYPIKVTLPLALYYLFNLLLFLGIPLALLNGQSVWALTLALGAKGLGEGYFLHTAARVFRNGSIMRFFLPAFLLHIPYVVYFGFLGQFQKYRWGGRRR